jgi:prepilin-type N-terminal cleavage/methylation domain-containing protein
MTGKRKSHGGFTIMEIMIVIAIIAMVTSGIILGFSSLSRSRLRSSAYLLAAASQRAFSLSTSRNESVRLIIDLDENTLGFESTEGKVLIDKDHPEEQEEEEEKADETAGKEEVKDEKKPSSAAEEQTPGNPLGMAAGGEAGSGKFSLGANELAERIKEGFHEGEVPRYKPPTFSPVADRLLSEKKLESGVRFFAVYSQLLGREKKDGKAYVYFFSDGTADHTAVQIQGKSGEIYTVEILPTSAKIKIYDYPFVPDFEEDSYEK